MCATTQMARKTKTLMSLEEYDIVFVGAGAPAASLQVVSLNTQMRRSRRSKRVTPIAIHVTRIPGAQQGPDCDR
jgi:hypothetical protein